MKCSIVLPQKRETINKVLCFFLYYTEIFVNNMHDKRSAALKKRVYQHIQIKCKHYVLLFGLQNCVIFFITPFDILVGLGLT